MGTRSKRMERIRVAMPIVAELESHGRDCDSVWWARNDSRGEPPLWLTTPFSVNPRGDDVLAESNYRVIMADLEQIAIAVYCRVDLWPGGQIRTIQVRADDALALRAVQQWVDALSDYPVADDEDYSELEWEHNHPAADNLCYSDDEDCSCGREKA